MKPVVDVSYRETNYHYTLSYVPSLASLFPEGQSTAIDVIALASRLPSLFAWIHCSIWTLKRICAFLASASVFE